MTFRCPSNSETGAHDVLPIRPRLEPYEAPASFLGRCARVNGWRIEEIIPADLWSRILSSRAIDEDTAHQVNAATLAPVESLLHGALDAYPSQVTGETAPGYATATPLGWSLTRWSSRCPACHDTGEPWPVQHQTGLAFACLRHARFLVAPCGACSPRRTMFIHGNVDCPHQVNANQGRCPEDLMTLQHDLLTRLEQSKTSRPDADWLNTLRAVTVLAWVDAAMNQRSPHQHAPLTGLARRRLLATTKTGGRRLAARLDRPLSDPLVNAHLLATSLHHLDEHGDVDTSWAEAVNADIDPVASLLQRAAPHLLHLNLRVPRDPGPEIHRRWRSQATRAASEWLAADRGGDHLPAALRTASEDISTPWPITLARAALLRMSVSGESATAAVVALGHHFTHVTSVRRHLTKAPEADDLYAFRAAVDRLLAAPATDYAAARAAAAATSRISVRTLSFFSLRPPSTRVVDPSTSAAAWLWLFRTGGHPVAIPFLDGRSSASLTPLLDDWSREVPPERLLALVEHLDSGVLKGSTSRVSGAPDASHAVSDAS